MPDEPAEKLPVDVKTSDKSPLVFISHDNRDAELAKAFSILLKSVSAGTLKSFRSSDKEGTEGIEFGDEWYRRLMDNLKSACDVVCIFTEHSLNRPWILYEAGVAKGKHGIPVFGVALGVPLSRVSVGPFYQFQNCEDDEESLTKLVLQLCKRIPTVDPVEDVVRDQVKKFIGTVSEILQNSGDSEDQQEDDSSVAKIYEEIKVMVRDLPDRIDDHIASGADGGRPKRIRQFHPTMIDDMIHMSEASGPAMSLSLLIFASFLKDDLPVVYEITMELYQASRSRNKIRIMKAIREFRQFSDLLQRSAMGFLLERDRESHMIVRELHRVVDQLNTRMETSSKAGDKN